VKAIWNRYKYWIKWIFSLGLLAIFFFKVDWHVLGESIKMVTWWYYPVVILLSIVNQTIAALRWRLFLPEHKFDELLRLNFIGLFYAFALPSTITGDVARVIQIDKKGKGTTPVLAGVFLDKILGLLALLFLVLIAIFITEIEAYRAFLWPVVIVTMALLTVYLLFYTKLYPTILSLILRAGLSRISWFNNKMPHFQSLIQNVSTFAHQFKIVASSFILAILFQITILLSYLALDYLFHFQLNIFDYFIISGITQLLMLLPLGIGGVGMKDVSNIVMLGFAGIATERALAASLVGYPALLAIVATGYFLSLNIRKT
jgi:uncharacterized protein (TIRG00374 family)